MYEMETTSSGAAHAFTLDIADLTFTGLDLQGPVSVLAERDGTLWVVDARGGCTRIAPDGAQQFFGGLGGAPRGLAVDSAGNLLIGNVELGCVHRLYRDGRSETVLAAVDGQPLTCANFVFTDRQGRLWITCCTRAPHWWPAVAAPRPDGFVVLVDDRGPRIVADGLLTA